MEVCFKINDTFQEEKFKLGDSTRDDYEGKKI